MSTPPPSNWLPDHAVEQRPDNPPKKMSTSVIVAISAIALIITGLSIFTLNYEPEKQSAKDIMATATSVAPQDEKTTSSESEDILGWSRAEARRECERKIEDQLAAPNTAKFSGITSTEFTKTDDGSSWRIAGHVDAQNSFGVELRSDYTCTVTPSSSERATVNAYLED